MARPRLPGRPSFAPCRMAPVGSRRPVGVADSNIGIECCTEHRADAIRWSRSTFLAAFELGDPGLEGSEAPSNISQYPARLLGVLNHSSFERSRHVLL